MLNVETRATIDACESYLDSIEADQVDRLLLAHRLRHAHCGGAASLVQVVNTWSRSEPAPTLLTHARPPNVESAINNLVETLPGLAAVLMSSDVLERDGLTSARATAYGRARHRVEAMDERRLGETARGSATTLLCADQTTKWALRPFYRATSDGPTVRGESDFVDLADDLISVALGQVRRRDLTDADLEAAGVMLRELFANTHYHARSDASGRPYRRSIRGVHVAQHALHDGAQVAGGFAPLAEYLQSLLARPRLAARAKALEISVFDSGPGYAARRAGGDVGNLPIAEEYALVRDCLVRNVSTRGEAGAGIGLPRMLSRLKARRGFLRLRTGRLSLVKSFADAEGASLRDRDYELEDGGGRADGFSRFAPVSGAVITLLIPIGR